MSFKDDVRKTIIAVSAMAIATSFFTGCSPDEAPSDEDLYSSDISTPIDSEVSSSDVVIDSTSDSSSVEDSDDSSDTIDVSNTSSDTTSTDTSEPEELTSTDTSTDISKPEEPTSESTQSSTTSSEVIIEGGKPVQSATPVSSSKPVESRPAPSSSTKPVESTPPSSSGNEFVPGKYTGYTPDDTTGVELDENGLPADGKAWRKKHKKNSFVDATGQLWNYGPTGWHKPTPGGLTEYDGRYAGEDEIVGH